MTAVDTTLADALVAARTAGRTAHEAGEWLDKNPHHHDQSQPPADYVRTRALERAWRRGWLSVGSVLDNLATSQRIALGVSPDLDALTIEQYRELQLLERGDATRVKR